MNNVSSKAAHLIGSEIIRLGNEINTRVRQGESIYNLTIGDFDPKIFPIPQELKRSIIAAYEAGETNYPPADGIAELKTAIRAFLASRCALPSENDEVMVAGGGRPLIYAIYQTLVDPGDVVVYPTPSWNNNHYCYLTGARGIEIETKQENGFMPTANELAPVLGDATLLALCSPLNPTGTTFTKDALEDICDLVIEENKRRAGNRKPLYVLYDQIYWMLRAEGVDHVHPVMLRPEMKAYTIYVDGISKSLAATGVRVGWSIGPAHVVAKMKSILGHIGAWAPRAEQVATATFLGKDEAVDAYLSESQERIQMRFDALYKGLSEMRDRGYPVNVIRPQGAIYVTVQFAIPGMTTTEITSTLLNNAHLAVVPFTAFGCADGTNWFRLSIGTLREQDIETMLMELANALEPWKS
ncbi:MAG: aminotransferase class I/II-fold pyridoxal phosphate-dependent enzyme [Candidatus Kapabacteria bacterium]|nr:aminotransferase class I/II-fold pyridoxal phosphate-dependent enzyme [Candidatus Kapabacteria bacterium]